MEEESNMKMESLKQIKEEGKHRRIRAAIREKQKNVNERENTITQVSSVLSNQNNSRTGDVQNYNRTGDVQNYNSTLRPSADSLPGNGTLSDPPGPRETLSQSKIQNINQGLTPKPTTHLGSSMSETTLRTHSSRFGALESQKSRQTAAQQPSPKHTDLRNPNPSAGLDVLADGVISEHNRTVRPAAPSSRDEGTKSAVKYSMKENDSKEKHSDRDSTADGTMKDNEVVDVKERELEHKKKHSDAHSHHKSEKTGFDSVPKSQPESPPLPRQHLNPQPASYLLNSHDCDGCKDGEHCECNKEPGAEARAAVVNQGLPRTPRTDEAVWAAAALGFLLVLLTLSVLHTRLYRYWRTTPSLYWHDPQQDYDSVAGGWTTEGSITRELF